LTQKQFALSEVDQKTLRAPAVAAVVEPTRLRILFLLGEKRRLCVGDIASHFRISRPAVSHHLKILKDHGAVSAEKVGQEVYYTVDTGHLVAMLRNLADALEQCCPAEK
jgi:ArsR family transcriptional regulator, arsenate/arsenite/antimonite-responsive transcriptional repressor